MENEIQKPNEIIKPPVSETAVPGLMSRFYGLRVQSQRQMISYDDRNFHIKAESIQKQGTGNGDLKEYTLKITNSLETSVANTIECVVEIQRLINLSGTRVKVPMPVANLDGKYVVRVTARDLNPNEELNDGHTDDGKLYAVHLLTYLPGTTMYNVPYTPDVLNQFGQTLADLSFALQTSEISSVIEPLRDRRNLWSMYNIPSLRPFLESLKSSKMDSHKVSLIEACLRNFEERVLDNPYLKKIPLALIHGDFNEHNVIVQTDSDCNPEVYGVLDFADCQFAPRLFEVSIAMAYAMIESKLIDPLDAAAHVLYGYQTRTKEIGVIEPLSQSEIDLVKVCIEGRLSQSLTMGAYTREQDPSNTYVISTAERGWSLLEKLLLYTDPKDLKERWNSILDNHDFSRVETSVTKF